MERTVLSYIKDGLIACGLTLGMVVMMVAGVSNSKERYDKDGDDKDTGQDSTED